MRRIAWLSVVLAVGCTSSEESTKKAPELGGALAMKLNPRKAKDDKPAADPPPPSAVRPEALEVTTPSESDDLKLKPIPGGGFEHVDRENGFKATIQPDGVVRFRDLNVAGVVGTAKDGKARLQGKEPEPHPAEADGIETVPQFNGDDGPLPILGTVGGRVGNAAAKNNPAKREFLRKTTSLRASLAAKARNARIEQGVRQSGAVAIGILKDESKSVALRKQTVFDMWDQSLEMRDDLSDSEKQAAEAGEEARRKIEKAIASVAPSGSKLEYTESEVERLNQVRTSTQPFDPYGKG